MQNIETIKGRIGTNSLGAEIYKNKLEDIVSLDFYDFRHQFGTKVFQVTTKSTVTDYDVNDSNELLVGAGQDGSFVAWNLQSGLELRRIQFAGKCFNIFDTL